MKLCCTSYSFDRAISEGEMSLRDFYQFCQEAGVEGIELWDLHLPDSPDGKFVEETKQELRAVGLPLATIAVNNHKFASLNASERARDVAKIQCWIDVVSSLNCSVLRVLPGELKALNTHRATRYPLVRAAFEECLPYAQAHGVTLAVENCPREAQPEVVVDLIKDLNTPFLRACPDIGNSPQAVRYRAWEDAAPFAVHVHAKTFDFDDRGEETTIDYSRAIGILKKSGYKGYLSIEFEGDGDEIVGVQKSIHLARRHLGAGGGD